MIKGTIFPVLLTFAFIILKLTETIAWSWWWVVSPLWMAILLVLVVMAIIWTAFKLWEKRIFPIMVRRIKK